MHSNKEDKEMKKYQAPKLEASIYELKDIINGSWTDGAAEDGKTVVGDTTTGEADDIFSDLFGP